jgi:hypothetical protein
MLKIVGDTIVTSHGARVPERAAIVAYKRLKNQESIIDFHIGGFSVQKVEADYVKVGCHTIPLAEIERLAAIRNWQ